MRVTPLSARFPRVALLVALSSALWVSFSKAADYTWNLPGNGSWNLPSSWIPTSGTPNAAGDTATFNSAASGSNPAQTGTRTITLDGTKTVGSITFNNDAVNAFNNSITTGTGGPLVFDVLTGFASIVVNGITGATGNNTISVAIRLDDDLVATVNNTTASSAAGALNLTAAISGTGGFTKAGDGLATFGTGAKSYTGATVLNGGRIRISAAAAPTASSSFTINAGAQLTPINGGSFSFGAGVLNLNGVGATSGPFAAFPGAIRPNTNDATTITNAVVLQSDTLIHVQGAATGVITFTNAVSGPGQLFFTAANSNADLGRLALNGTNSYSGGTTVRGGTLEAGIASVNAFGTGNVTILSGATIFPGAIAKLSILAGATDAISDNATLSLAGGTNPTVADDGFVFLDTGINETVGNLVLGGITQTKTLTPQTFGSTTSGAMFQNDEYFAGDGIIVLAAIPEPSHLLLVCAMAAVGFTLLRRSRETFAVECQ